MNLVTAQQVVLDNALVALEKQIKIEKHNVRIKFSKPQRETTYRVILDALKLSPCHPAFLITAEVPDVYMHQFWNTIKKIKDTDAYRCIFKKSTGLDRLRPSRAQILWGMFYQKNVDYVALQINLYTFCDDTLLGTLKFVSKTEDYQNYGALIPEEMINQTIKDSKAYKIYLDFATRKATPKKARKFKKITSPSQKLTTFLEEELAKKPKRAKKPEPTKQAETAKKTTLTKRPSTMKIAGVVIR
ncbi:hypothetical protein Tco_0896537 [Tanacetum coccineum]